MTIIVPEAEFPCVPLNELLDTGSIQKAQVTSSSLDLEPIQYK